VNRLPSRFNAKNRRNTLLGLILIIKIPGSRGMIIQYPSVKTRYSSIPFCEVIPKKNDKEKLQFSFSKLPTVLQVTLQTTNAYFDFQTTKTFQKRLILSKYAYNIFVMCHFLIKKLKKLKKKKLIFFFYYYFFIFQLKNENNM
jgi:hypothetical protein